MSQVLWVMHGTIMLEERRIRGDRSIVAYAYKIAVEYGLDKVSVRQAYKKLVKRVIKQTNDLKLLTDCFNYRSLCDDAIHQCQRQTVLLLDQDKSSSIITVAIMVAV